MKPRVFKRGGWWRQIGPGLRMYAAPTISVLSATVRQHDAHHPWFSDAGEA